LFDLEDLGPQHLAGFAEPQLAWRVLSESGEVSRFEALRSGDTPLVGRAEEIELLQRRWEQAKRGKGRVWLISGEPGIGKSRLAAALSAHMEGEPHTRLRYFCSPQQRFDALYGVWQSTNMSGGSAAASPLSARLLSMTEQEGDEGLQLQALHSAWATLAFAGDPAKTREHTDAGRLLYDPEKRASHRFVYGSHDPGACALLLGAWAEWLLGYPEKALASSADSVSLAERIAHPFTLGLALTFGAVLHLNRREPERA